MVEIPGLDQNKLRNICKEDNLSLVVLFGSHSRGQADKNSECLGEVEPITKFSFPNICRRLKTF